MANTANDLARDVALELNIIDAISDLDAASLADLKRISKFKHAEWQRMPSHFVYWDYDDVPDEVMRPLTLVLAAESGKTFGKVVRDDGLDEAQTRRARLRALKSVSSLRYTGQPVKAEYF
jgi:hypothetical protein